MIRILFIAFTVLVCSTLSLAQTSGNVGYSQSGSSARAKQNERNKKAIPATEAPPTGTTMFVDASVMINVKADEFVAVFGVAQECATVPDRFDNWESAPTIFTSIMSPRTRFTVIRLPKMLPKKVL